MCILKMDLCLASKHLSQNTSGKPAMSLIDGIAPVPWPTDLSLKPATRDDEYATIDYLMSCNLFNNSYFQYRREARVAASLRPK